MKVSLEWIERLLPALEATAPAIAKRLDASGTAVDGVEHLAQRLAGVVVGEVREVEPHPNADQLKLTRVFDGAATHSVVCGAPNVEVGQKVPFAPVGCVLPGGLRIEPRAIRGVESRGMLCSADELGLALKSQGLLVLGDRVKPGEPLADALKIEDVVFDLDVTPNRADLLSHFGLAREIAALWGLSAPKYSVRLEVARRPAADAVGLSITAQERCPLYAGRVIEGVRVGPSPDWVQRRLLALGQRPVSNVVDATNLILLELGQPLHAFDLDRLAGPRIEVRTARSKERLRLLDGTALELDEDDLVIADAERSVALAGVMGGADSEVGDGTTRLMLESAWFQPAGVRRTAKRHGLHTEASHRFERGVDPEMVQTALDACAALIVELAGGEVLSGRVAVDVREGEAPIVSIRPARAELLLGRPVGRSEIRKALRRLGLRSAPGQANKGELRFVVPSWRRDLEREVDLIEEVARLGGYDEIPVTMPAAAPAVRGEAFRPRPERLARRALAGIGFREAVSLGFSSSRDAEIFGVAERSVVSLRNPLGEETRHLRFSLLPGLLAATRRNQDALPSITDLRLFELGRAFRWSGDARDLPEERSRLALLMRGRRRPGSWADPGEATDVFDLIGALELTCERIDRPKPRIERDDVPWLHPRAAGRLVEGDRFLGRFGQLHPDVMDAYGLEGPPVFVAEIDLEPLFEESERPTFRPLAPHPPAQRDLSFFIDRERPAQGVLDTIRRVGAPRDLESVDLFDVYEGRGVPDGRRSLAVALVFRAPDRTLTDAEVDETQAEIVKALEAEHAIALRSGA